MAELTRRQFVPDPQQIIEDLLTDLSSNDEAHGYLDAVATLDVDRDDLIEVCIQMARRLLECESDDDG